MLRVLYHMGVAWHSGKTEIFLLTQKFEKMGGLGLFIAIMWIAVMATGDN